MQAVETAFSQGPDLRRGGPDEVAADAGFLDSVAVRCEVDNVCIITSAHAPGHAAKHGLGHSLGGLQSGVGLQRDLAAPVGAPHAGTGDGDLLASQGGRTPLVAVPRVGPVGLTLIRGPHSRVTSSSRRLEATSIPSLSAKLSKESCIRSSNASRSRESWITRSGAPMGTAGWVGSGLWESCRFASARFKAVPPSSQGKSHVQSSDRTGGAALFTFQLRSGHPR